MGLTYAEAERIGIAHLHPDDPALAGRRVHPERPVLRHAHNKGRRVDGRNDLGQNKGEARFHAHLEMLRRFGFIAAAWWEPFNLRVAGRCYYRVDFLAQRRDGSLCAFDVKGMTAAGRALVEDDALVKIKACADKYPCFSFFLAAPDGPRWSVWPVGRGGVGPEDTGGAWANPKGGGA